MFIQERKIALFFLTRFFVKNVVGIWVLGATVDKRRIQIKCTSIEITIVISVKPVEHQIM